jgi:metal-responsive CopG/Arc/MetJ family transcriptional regulator
MGSRTPNTASNSEKTERATVRIPVSKLEKLDEIIDDETTEEHNRSTAIREGIDMRIAKYRGDEKSPPQDQ